MERPGGKFLEVGGLSGLAIGRGLHGAIPSYLSAQSHKVSYKISFVYFAASFDLENVRSQFHSLRQSWYPTLFLEPHLRDNAPYTRATLRASNEGISCRHATSL
jgi:hypothetical protein